MDASNVRSPYVGEAVLGVLLDQLDNPVAVPASVYGNVTLLVRRGRKLYCVNGRIDPDTVLTDCKRSSRVPHGLRRFACIPTLHPYGDEPEKFRATAQQVVSMIPERLLCRVKAFEVIGPQSERDLARQQAAIDAGFHAAAAVLYRAAPD